MLAALLVATITVAGCIRPEYPQETLWIWDALWLSDGSIVPTPSAIVQSASDVCASGPVLRANSSGSACA